MNTIDLVSIGFTFLALVYLAAHAAVEAKSIKKTSRVLNKNKFKIKNILSSK
jgi:hypothetical protein